MPYAQSQILPMSEPKSPQAKWEYLQQNFANVLHEQEKRLQAESEGLNLGEDPSWLLRHAPKYDPKKVLKLFEEVNPQVDLQHLSDYQNPEDQYLLAVALLRLFSAQEAEKYP